MDIATTRIADHLTSLSLTLLNPLACCQADRKRLSPPEVSVA